MNSSRLSAFCDRALEAGWLLAVTITPVFFNVYSDRVFEPDKLTTLRALAVIMAVLWLVRFLEEVWNGEKPLRISWRTPMVLPALLTMTIYLISTAFSLVPYTSLLGSYQRLQGTQTLFGYLVLFFTLITGLRTRRQFSRLVTVLILNSLPISLYGIIQHNGLDPLPWAGDVTSRVASNMGNAIFVAAYLIMIVPLTVARIVESFNDILSREEAKVSDILRASGYIFILAVQVLTIWYSQSRGPWLGVVAAVFLFPYLALMMLQRKAVADAPDAGGGIKDVLKGFAFGVGVLALAGVLAGVSLLALKGSLAIYIGGGLAALTLLAAYGSFVVERKGWRWLWIGWGTVGLTIALGIVLVNVPGPLQDRARQVDVLRRLTTITELQSGTGKVRGLIWQGAVELIKPHAPIKYPDEHGDAFNVLRPLVGYGPESMYVAYNSFYPTELGHYESRTASPDRSHNETLDSVVITGALGLAVYLFTFISVFYWGFRFLGLLATRKQLWLYLGLSAFFAVVFFLIAWRVEGAYLFAVAIPLGVLVGTVAYLTVEALRVLFHTGDLSEAAQRQHPHTILIVAILAAVLGHFVEINFGIAIASTRTTFWAFAAILVALGSEWVPGIVSPTQAKPVAKVQSGVRDERARRRRRASRSRVKPGQRTGLAPWLVSVLALTLVATFLLGTLAYDFVNNPERLSDGGQVFGNSLTLKYHPEKTRSYGALMIVMFTWVLFGVVGLSEFDREGLFEENRNVRWVVSIGTYAVLSLIGFLIFGSIIAAHQAHLTQIQPTTIDGVVEVAENLASLLGWYYALIFTIMIAAGIVLMWEDGLPLRWAEPQSPIILLLLLLVSVLIIRVTSYNLIRADIVFKQGKVFAESGNVNDKQIGIAHYEKSLDYVPHEDYYDLFLGKAYLELAQGYPTSIDALSEEQKTSLLAQAFPDRNVTALSPEERDSLVQQIKPNWEAQQKRQQSELFYRTEEILRHARDLNPLNTDHSANLARFYKSWTTRVSSDLQQAGLTDEQKAALQAQRADLLQKSLENYQTALILSPHNPILWNELAQLYGLDFADIDNFEKTIEKSLQVDKEYDQTWLTLAQMRASTGNTEGAIEACKAALEINPKWESVWVFLGDIYSSTGDPLAAIDAYRQSLEVRPDFREHCSVRRVLGSVQAQQGLWSDAVQTLEAAVEKCSGFRDLWDVYRVLAISYANQQRIDAAIPAAMQALELAPDAQKSAVQQLIDTLQGQLAPVTPAPTEQP